VAKGDFRLDDNGNGNGKHGAEALAETEEYQRPETQEQLQAVAKKLSDLSRGESPVISFTKKELGMLAKLISPPPLSPEEKKQAEIEALMIMADYTSPEEADLVTAVINFSSRYGLSLNPIRTWIMNRLAANRKGARNNRAAQIMDTLSHNTQTIHSIGGKGSNDGKQSRDLIK
jgi:hypothetical protein